MKWPWCRSNVCTGCDVGSACSGAACSGLAGRRDWVIEQHELEAEAVRVLERERIKEALRAAFSSDEFEENAEAAVCENEWSWFKWLALSVFDDLPSTVLLAQQVRGVLDAHVERFYGTEADCSCGQWVTTRDESPEGSDGPHRAHVVAKVIEALTG